MNCKVTFTFLLATTVAILALCSRMQAQTAAPAASSSPVAAQSTLPRPWQTLGGPRFQNWIGVRRVNPGSLEATLTVPGEATFRYPQPEEGKAETDSQRKLRDWFNAYGMRFEVQWPDERPVRLDVRLLSGPNPTASTLIAGKGWHTVSLSWKSFDFSWQDAGLLRAVAGLSIAVRFDGGGTGQIVLRSPRLVRGDKIWLNSDVRGKAVEAGGAAEYSVLVGNPTDAPQGVTLSFEKSRYDAMQPSVSPSAMLLKAGEIRRVTVRVAVPSRVPPGGHETQILRAAGNGSSSPFDKLKFVTASKLPYPNIVHTKEGWDGVREKVKKYDWARERQKEYVKHADNWNVPNVSNTNNPKRGDWLFVTNQEHNFMAAGIAYQLTGDAKYAKKVKTLLLRLSDPETGFPVTRRASNQSSVQEGHFFQHLAMSYDMTIPSGLYSSEERARIDETFRLFVGPAENPELPTDFQISNWSVSFKVGQLYSALVLQDLAAAQRFIHAPMSIIDQLVYGTLDDGWWYELSISYNTWVAEQMSQVAIAMRPWGYNLVDAHFPANYRSNEQRIPEKAGLGHTDAMWGPIQHNYMSIKRMWDVIPKMVDYRGVMFGLNDSTENRVSGGTMDIAYYLYRDPAYATVIKRGGGSRDLIYGVPELPEDTPDPSARSAYSDNAGVAVLRSAAQGKPARERIQAVLTYGDHGWFHGHFDNVALGHLSRYGRSFFNPEMVWYGYPNYMYKFYVQTSVSKNMVVVDQKMQEPAPNERILFHDGDLLQAAAVQTTTRWSNPPYGGMTYWDQPHKTFADKAFAEGRSVPIPADAPSYGAVTGYTEPILQRRLMVVTDDYVVLADYLKADKEHTFENVFQMKGFQSLEAAGKTLVRHTGQWNPDPVGSAQFVTDADWYAVSAPACGSYQFRWGEGADNAGTRTDGEPGILNMDLYTLWPPRHEIMIGTVPETHNVQRQVSYAVRGDGKALTEGKSGMWILGEQNIDVPLAGVKSLELETQTGATRPGTLFWANARVLTADGKAIPLSQLPVTFDNTMQPKEKGKDFEGGPIKIAGIPYSEAISAQPQDGKKPSIARVDLSGINAVRFQSTLGGDFPVGDESQRRKTVAVRSVGKEARFLTIIEPFEDRRMVKTATATGPDTLRVELMDGRVHELKIANLEGDGANLTTAITESKDGKVLRSETTAQR